jgi:hypothetical protein
MSHVMAKGWGDHQDLVREAVVQTENREAGRETSPR